MKKLPRPNIKARDSYYACVSAVIEVNLKTRLETCYDYINKQVNDYIAHASIGTLFSLIPLKHQKNEDPIVIGKVLKSELIKLYDYYMLQKHPARAIYDEILIAANDKCPFCGGIGRPKTLDHYLPKAKYPQFSVFPLNLIPACRDCNTDKSNRLALNANEQVLHPYLDEEFFFSIQWIFALVVTTEPCTLSFYTEPPISWDKISRDRVHKHFESFDLAKRYSIQTAEELSTLIYQRSSYLRNLNSDDFKKHLQSVATSPTLFANHWKKVMYQALSENEWFCNKQF